MHPTTIPTAAEALEAARQRLRSDLADHVIALTHIQNRTTSPCGHAPTTYPPGADEDLRGDIERLVYALDGEVPPWDPSVEIRDLMAAAGGEAKTATVAPKRAARRPRSKARNVVPIGSRRAG